MKRIAVIVIGSNSTRMVSSDEALASIVRRRVETRLFLHMENNRFSQDTMTHLVQALVSLREEALREGAQLLGIYATSAVRDAENADVLSAQIAAACSLPLTILSGAEEATYSFYGAAGEQRCGMIDIGGGSTEIAIGQGRTMTHALSLQLGASRLFRMQPVLTPQDCLRALSLAEACLAELPEALIRDSAGLPFYVVGGTGTAALRMGGKQEEEALSYQEISALLDRIAQTPREKRLLLPAFPAARLDIFPTGLCILVALMRKLSLPAVTITNRSNADGLLRAFVHKKFA